eukprot:2344444-Ditylum_brightwellii.AAC.1
MDGVSSALCCFQLSTTERPSSWRTHLWRYLHTLSWRSTYLVPRSMSQLLAICVMVLLCFPQSQHSGFTA